MKDFMFDLDLNIQNNNTDYKAKRFKNITLDNVETISSHNHSAKVTGSKKKLYQVTFFFNSD